MFFIRLHVAVLLVAVCFATINFRRAGWLDRVVAWHKNNFFKELGKFSPIKFNAEIHRKPPGYVDSTHWDFDSVTRLLTLIRQSESAKPVRRVLRRMLHPTLPNRRIMMSMKESMKRFPSKAQDGLNNFYYDIEYTDDEEKYDELPPPPPVPEDDVVLVVSNPVEARLPSARISVKLLREILEARARAARQMPSKPPSTIPWKPMNKTARTTAASTAATDGCTGTDTTAGEEGEGEKEGEGEGNTTEDDTAANTTGEDDATATTAAEDDPAASTTVDPAGSTAVDPEGSTSEPEGPATEPA